MKKGKNAVEQQKPIRRIYQLNVKDQHNCVRAAINANDIEMKLKQKTKQNEIETKKIAIGILACKKKQLKNFVLLENFECLWIVVVFS